MLTTTSATKIFSQNASPEQKSNITCLFIEAADKEVQDYHFHYSDSFFTNTITEAKKVLQQSEIVHDVPQIIVLDLKITAVELHNFRKWLQTHISEPIPLVLNEGAIDKENTRMLFSKKLVEDIINLDKNYLKLPYKANFLKKLMVHVDGSIVQPSEPALSNNHQFSPVKRSIDILISAIAIIACLPIFILIAIAIRLESKGPIIYKADRAGKGYRVFKFLKFRTMIVDADKKIKELAKLNLYNNSENNPAFFKIKDDPRVTKVGAFLRNTSLDELPQLFNVLKGDMSIVGNRPLPLYEASSLTTNEWAERFMAPAGITGLWQISKRGKEDMSTSERISLDIAYARTRTLRGDLRIILKTPSVLLQKVNV